MRRGKIKLNNEVSSCPFFPFGCERKETTKKKYVQGSLKITVVIISSPLSGKFLCYQNVFYWEKRKSFD